MNQRLLKGFHPRKNEKLNMIMIRGGRHKKRKRFGCKIKIMASSPGPQIQKSKLRLEK